MKLCWTRLMRWPWGPPCGRWSETYKVNLLPAELQRDFSLDVRKLVTGSVAALVLTGLCAGYAYFLYQLQTVKAAAAGARQYLGSLRDDVAAVEEIKKKRIKNEQTVKSLREIMEKRITWSQVLEEIDLNIPADIWLTRMELGHRDLQKTPGPDADGGVTKVQPGEPADAPPAAPQQDVLEQRRSGAQRGPGGAPQNSAPPPNVLVFEGCSGSVASVGVFVNNLRRMTCFSNIVLNEVNRDEKTAVFHFKITAMVKGGER